MTATDQPQDTSDDNSSSQDAGGEVSFDTQAAQETFDTETSFKDLGLNEALQAGVKACEFVHPTRIQSALIPPAIKGRHVLGQAKTGTGKTAAFGLPVLNNTQKGDKFAALVLVPTRELAIQISKELRDLGRKLDLSVVTVYGGQRIRTQAPKLEKGAEIIVGTPGRVMDMHERGLLPYKHFKMVVLDEVDRMLDIGFRDDIRRILGNMKQKPQLVFVSATISGEIEKLARQYMTDPEKIVTSEQSLTVARVKQSWLKVERWDKKRMLLHLLRNEEAALTLVFCRTKRTVDDLTKYLNKHKIDAHAIHGDMYQGHRNRVMDRLRGGELSVLVASDLASRGLDVDGISHVINYDIPEDPEIYIHRIGRTARAGRHGIAWTMVTSDQGDLLTNCEMLANVEIPQQVYEGFKPGPVPEDIRTERELKENRETSTQQNRASAPKIEEKTLDPALFPDGVVPSKLPSRRMQGRVRTRRR
ncbi:MAG: DEAD/DEAH box helicase [Phycisphaerales bacterium]|nr:DEAD/DEAH box helicase [Phycisphaerales bacterium]